MYRDVLASIRKAVRARKPWARAYRGREKEAAARIVEARAHGGKTRHNARGFVFAHPGGSIVGGHVFETLEAARRRGKRISAARRRALVVRDLETGAEHVLELARPSSSSSRATVATVTGAVPHAHRKRNPPLPVRTFTGKSGHLVSEHVLALEYKHAASVQRTPYRHDFGGEVELWALRDGSLLLRGGHGQRLWEDFYVRDGE